MAHSKIYHSFKEFYPFYLGEHQNPISRRLHFIGTGSVILTILFIISWQAWIYLLLLPVLGYSFAWIGHFFFEKNKPATFQYPLYSLLGDFVMFKDILTGKIKW